MNRRTFLGFASFGSAVLAGCTGDSRKETSKNSTFIDENMTSSDNSPDKIPTDSQSANVIFVDANGSGETRGTRDEPFHSIQRAVDEAMPGDTVYVRPGEYREKVNTRRSGEPGNPITITGPKEAVLRSVIDRFYTVRLRHSHVHLTGLSLDGLADPENPDNPESYAPGELVQCKPKEDTDDYVHDLKVMPKTLGNNRADLVKLTRAEDVEIGEFEVTGIAGAQYILGDKIDHNGEILYIGTTHGIPNKPSYPWDTRDRTNNVHIHHIDNSAGHPHGDLVDLKPETHDCLVEYCTDRNAGHASDDSSNVAVVVEGDRHTIRYNDIAETPNPIMIGGRFDPQDSDRPVDNKVYYNYLHDYSHLAIYFQSEIPKPEKQAIICGNQVDGPTDGPATQTCPSDVSPGEGVGHTGGDSPWT